MTIQFPGARWWKFDVHTHTPASFDYGKGPDQQRWKAVSAEEWLLSFMRAGIDCIAVTDHNTADWINGLRTALSNLKSNAHPEYRDLHLFPGVEVTANGGVHVLAVFDPSQDQSAVDKLIGLVRMSGKGDKSVAALSPVEVVREISGLGGVPILAHVDGPSGAFKASNGNTLRELLDAPQLFAVEICDLKAPRPGLCAELRRAWAEVLGSDSHHPTRDTGDRYPGSHFTWIKMESPSIAGLRLALLDGNEFSVRRSDAVPSDFDPNRPPEEWIESVEIENSKYMGQGQRERLAFSPFLNALVGGRGTGKSTIVHFTRAALGRQEELTSLEESAEPRRAFESFFRPFRSRDEEGVLTDQTTYRLAYWHGGKRFRLSATAEGAVTVEEATDGGQWRKASSQEIRARFPIRIFSQGQVLALAGRTSGALLKIVDENAGVDDQDRAFNDESSRFLALRARARELRQRLTAKDRVRAQLEDVRHKLAKFESTQHAAILKEHQRRSRQVREVESQSSEVEELAARVRGIAAEFVLSDVPDGLFDESDTSDRAALEVLNNLRAAVEKSRNELDRIAASLRAAAATTRAATSEGALAAASHAADEAYRTLVTDLRAEGVSDPAQFGALMQDRQRLEVEEKELAALETRVQEVERDARACLDRLGDLRREKSKRRRDYVTQALEGNRFVRITIDEYGRDPHAVSLALREVLGVLDDRFTNDLPSDESGAGLTGELFRDLPDGAAGTAKIEARLLQIKARLQDACEGRQTTFGGHLQNFLQREYGRRPEFLDRLLLWFPEDALRVEYSARGDGSEFKSIRQASAGQKAAAMLAFFLAHGTEPIVLDQPEDDLDNHLIYELVVQQLRDGKRRRQIITVTHNPNIVVNGDAEMVHAFDVKNGQCKVTTRGSLQDAGVREEVCRVMEGGREAFLRRYRRLAERSTDV